MYFRCPDCLSVTWLDRLEAVREAEELGCAECEGRFTAHPIAGLRPTVGDHYQRSLRFSNEKQIDMPTAYSVMLGLLTLDEVRLFQGLVTPEPSLPAAAKEALDGALLLDLDPGFQKAVNDGCLTVQEAIRRGNRDAHAASLAKRHGLSRELAFGVTDNRISLHEALRREPPAAPPAPPKRPITVRERRIVLGVALLAVAGVGWSMWSASFETVREPAAASLRRSPPPAAKVVETPRAESVPDRPPQATSTEVLTDSMGRVTRIVGPDPDAVLAAYCGHGGPLASKQPVDIAQTEPRSPNARLGIYRDLDSLAADQAIRIRRDWRTRRWVAGDGRYPIPVGDAPALPGADLRASAGESNEP